VKRFVLTTSLVWLVACGAVGGIAINHTATEAQVTTITVRSSCQAGPGLTIEGRPGDTGRITVDGVTVMHARNMPAPWALTVAWIDGQPLRPGQHTVTVGSASTTVNVTCGDAR
jgi:hypothetical protein